jgi:hypothetical protein
MKNKQKEDWERFMRTGKVSDYLAYKQAERKECRQNSQKPS